MLQQVEAEALQTASVQTRPGSQHVSTPATQITNLSVTSLRPLILDFSNNPIINVGKNLNVTKGATVCAISTNPDVQNAILRANNIFNYGTITSVLPNGGLPGYENALSNLNLTLVATQSLLNRGTISSAGSLSIFSAGSVSNNGSQAVMRAQNDLNILSPNIQNSGQIQSIAANVNLNAPSTLAASISNLLPTNWQSLANNSFSISGKDGTISALSGAINIGDAAFKQQNFEIIDGDYLSKSLNINGANVLLSVQKIGGTLNADAVELHEFSNSKELSIGKICTVGDPTFYNSGDIQLTGDISVGENLAIIAGGNISSTAAVKSIVARDAQGQGYDIFLIAGAQISPDCGSCSSNAAPGTNANYSITVDPLNGAGGNIDFSQSSGLQIDASSTGADLNGANITLVATQGKAAVPKGSITLATDSLINSSGNGQGLNGNVQLMGPSNITIGAIEALGGLGRNGKNGNVTVASTNPETPPGSPSSIIFDKSGQASAGLIPSTSTFSDVNVGKIRGSSISLMGKLYLNGNLDTTSGGGGGSGGAVNISGSTYVNSGVTGIYADASANGNGGTIDISNNFASVDPGVALKISANGSGIGNGGMISIADFSAKNSIGTGPGKVFLSATGGSPGSTSGDGGHISIGNFASVDSSGVNAIPLGLNGNGAKLTISAFSDNKTCIVSGSLIADGVGFGNGGMISLAVPFIDTSNPSGAGRISADAGTSGGNGGTVTFETSQNTSVSTGLISVNATNGDGGKVNVYSLLKSSAALPIQANGGGTGDGGTIRFENSNADISIGNQPGKFILSATGGFPGSLSGNGGNIVMKVSKIDIDAAYCDASPLGTNGNGGTYYFTGTMNYKGVPQYSGVGIGKNGYAIQGDQTQSVTLISGLDLSDKTTVSNLLTAQQNYPYLFSGQLITQDGIAVGGELFISDRVNLTGLKGFNIPNGVSLRLFNGQKVGIDSGKHEINGALIIDSPEGGSVTSVIQVWDDEPLVVNGSISSSKSFALNTYSTIINGNLIGDYVGFTFSSTVEINGTITGKGQVEFHQVNNVQQSPTSIIETPHLNFQGFALPFKPATANFAGQNKIGILEANSDVFFLNNTFPLTLTSSSINKSITIVNSEKVVISNPVGFIPTASISCPILELNSKISYAKQGTYLTGLAGSTIKSTAPLVFSVDGISSDGNITFTGNFDSSNTTITSKGTIATEFGTKFQVNDNLVLNTVNLLNPNAFIAKSIVLNVTKAPNGNTIINPYGDIVLSSNTIINGQGSNIAVLAKGNIIANGVKSIDLTSKTSGGGSFLAVAGIEISGDLPRVPNGQSSDPYSIFILQNGSTTGGSISFEKTTINTSAQGTYSGGAITLIANKGSINPGTVITGTLNSSAQNGNGGNILVSGCSGIVIDGSIFSRGQSGGGNVQLNTYTIDVSGTEILGGKVTNFNYTLGTSPAGSAITVNGAIDASASFNNKSLVPIANGLGGSIQINSDGLAQISGNISTSGRIGGDITIASSSRGINVSGTINNSGVSPIVADTAGCVSCGNAGSIALSAPSFLNVSGKVISTGAAASQLSNRAGDGGSLNWTTSKISASNLYSGTITVRGFIDLTGGAGFSNMNSGNGGSLNTESGTIKISGAIQTKLGTASIIASAGSIPGSGSTGMNGNITIHTYSTQNIPENFNLASNNNSEYALAGGLFVVNEGPTVINGTKSNIIIGTTVIGKSTESNGVKAGNISYQKFDLAASGTGALSITAGGTPLSYSYDDGSKINSVLVAAGSAGHRSKITPSQAVALYEASNGRAQLFGMNTKGQVTALNLQKAAPSLINLDLTMLPSKFSSLQITAQGTPSSVTVKISGATPFINATSAQVRINGNLEFDAPGANASIYAKSVSLGDNANLSSTDRLNILSPQIVNAGTISAAHLFMQGNSSTTKFSNSKTGIIQTSDIGLEKTGAGFNLTINDKNTLNSGLNFLFYRPAISAEASEIAKLIDIRLNEGKANLRVSSFSSITVGGESESFSSILISNSSTNQKAIPDVVIATNAVLTSTSASIAIQAGGQLKLGNAVTVNGLSGIQLTAKGGIVLGDDNKLSSTNGHLQITANNGNITIGHHNTLTALGETVLARTGSIQIGNYNRFSATNGNLIMLAKQQFIAGTAPFFEATRTSSAPVIELGAGTTVNHVASAHIGKSSQLKIASNINYSGTINYRVHCTSCSQAFGNINISNNNTTADATFNGGTLVLDSIGSSNTLLIDGANIYLYKPVGFTTSNDARVALKDGNSFELLAGDLFVNPKDDLVLENNLINLHFKRNSLVSISRNKGLVSVVNFGNRGDVYFKTAKGRIVLEPGEELTLSSKQLTGEDLRKEDGIGRRAAKTLVLAQNIHAAVCDVSLVTVLANAQHFERIKHPKTAEEKQILNRIFKTASALQTVTAKRGAFIATPRKNAKGSIAAASI